MANLNTAIKLAFAFAGGWLLIKLNPVGFVLLSVSILWPSHHPNEEVDNETDG